MRVTAVLDAGAVALLALVHRPSQVVLLYALLVLQFSLISFYDPGRPAADSSLLLVHA
jgi:hypothetical protein